MLCLAVPQHSLGISDAADTLSRWGSATGSSMDRGISLTASLVSDLLALQLMRFHPRNGLQQAVIGPRLNLFDEDCVARIRPLKLCKHTEIL